MLTIAEHVQTTDGYRLVVHVPGTPPERLASIAGDAVAERDPETGEPTGDTLHTIMWGADVPIDLQRADTRALIEQALPGQPADPVGEPGTEL